MTRRKTVLVEESSATGWLSVYSPYNADFVKRARAMGGQWYGGAWHFSPDKAHELGALLDACFEGWDDSAKIAGRDGGANTDRAPDHDDIGGIADG